MRDIPWSTIPKTFQDVILLIKQLGLHYLYVIFIFSSLPYNGRDTGNFALYAAQGPLAYVKLLELFISQH